MGRLLKILGYAAVAFVGLLIITATILTLVFDPNDFREDISAGVARSSGRELVIEGDLDLTLFPWLAIDVGRTRLGNAPGFGEEPLATFEHARLSVRLMPLLLRREIAVGTAAIDSLTLNLQVRGDGRNNWQTPAEAGEADPDAAATADGGSATLDIASIDISNASINYVDAGSGDEIHLSDLNFSSGGLGRGEPVVLEGGFSFEMQPSGMSGYIAVETLLAFDSEAGLVNMDGLSIEGPVEGLADVPTVLELSVPALEIQTGNEVADFGEIYATVFGVSMVADVEPFSYADSPAPVAELQVDAFSARELMHALQIEVPLTADPNALGKVIVDARASVRDNTIDLTDMTLVLDDTTFSGTISVPRDSDGTYRMTLIADSIDLTRYMEPATEAEAGGGDAGAVPVDIPAELIRPLNARGSLSVAEAYLGKIRFESVQLGVNAAAGQMRIHPISASLFGGSYLGDVRINVAGETPLISVNESIRDVGLGPLALAMYEQENITGLVNGSFRLGGRGANTAAIQQSLKGDMSFELRDGSWEGTDVWHELRSARALFKDEAAPEPVLPARTQFNTVRATGTVTDGVMHSDDLFAELPFMQITGDGTVNFYEATIDYSMVGRILEKPEFMQGATAEEIDDFTQAVIPFRVRGPLSGPGIQPDVEGMLKKRVEEEIKDRLFDKLLGGRDEEPAAGEEDAGEQPAVEPDEEPDDERDLEEEVKDRLKDLLGT